MLKQTPEFIAGVNGLQVPRHVPQSFSPLGDEAGTTVSLPSQSNVVFSYFATREVVFDAEVLCLSSVYVVWPMCMILKPSQALLASEILLDSRLYIQQCFPGP